MCAYTHATWGPPYKHFTAQQDDSNIETLDKSWSIRCTQGRKTKEALANKKKRTELIIVGPLCLVPNRKWVVARFLLWPQFMMQLHYWHCFLCSILNRLLVQESVYMTYSMRKEVSGPHLRLVHAMVKSPELDICPNCWGPWRGRVFWTLVPPSLLQPPFPWGRKEHGLWKNLGLPSWLGS